MNYVKENKKCFSKKFRYFRQKYLFLFGEMQQFMLLITENFESVFTEGYA
jgi:hypothetical protein